MNKLTLGQRLLADTPDFFKKAHLFGLVLILASAVMAHFNLPKEAIYIVATVGGTVAGISPFAVKDTASLETQGFSLSNLLNMFGDITNGLSELKAAAVTPVALISTSTTDLTPTQSPAPVISPAGINPASTVTVDASAITNTSVDENANTTAITPVAQIAQEPGMMDAVNLLKNMLQDFSTKSAGAQPGEANLTIVKD